MKRYFMVAIAAPILATFLWQHSALAEDLGVKTKNAPVAAPPYTTDDAVPLVRGQNWRKAPAQTSILPAPSTPGSCLVTNGPNAPPTWVACGSVPSPSSNCILISGTTTNCLLVSGTSTNALLVK